MGNGTHVTFWHDKWCGDISLMERFPVLYQVAIYKYDQWRTTPLGMVVRGIGILPFSEVWTIGKWICCLLFLRCSIPMIWEEWTMTDWFGLRLWRFGPAISSWFWWIQLHSHESRFGRRAPPRVTFFTRPVSLSKILMGGNLKKKKKKFYWSRLMLYV